MKRLLPLLLLLLIAAPGVAGAASPMHQFSAREPVVVAADAAYVLFRIDPRDIQRPGLAKMDYDFIFVPADALTGDARDIDPKAENVIHPSVSKAYDSTPDGRVIFISLPPGRYVLAGLTFRDATFMGTCLCMGTVSFEAKAGVITDLGYLLGETEGLPPVSAEFPQPGPDGRRTWGDAFPPMLAAAVRPAAPAMPVPEPLKGAPIVPADYRAFGKFPNYFLGAISRLLPVAGVLAYDTDRIVDLKAR